MSTLVYDFTKKRVRQNGEVMSKYSLAYDIDALEPSTLASVFIDAYSYAELAKMLFDNLAAKGTIFGKPVDIIGAL